MKFFRPIRNNFNVEKYCQENKLNNSVNQQENTNDNKDVPVVDND